VVVRIDLRYEIAQRLFSPNLQTPPAAASSAPAKQGTAAAATTAATPAATPAQGDGSQKKKCQTTRLFGGKGGAAFDHGTNRGRIKKITVYANRKSVDGIGITYDATRNMAVRNGTGKDGDSLELADGEYVNKFTVRADDEVQCLTFYTNQGNLLGPCGGKGGFLSKGGEEFTIEAPADMMLCGIKGQAGSRLDAIAFHWGPCQTMASP
jgi:Jacalin-like lectin domain